MRRRHRRTLPEALRSAIVGPTLLTSALALAALVAPSPAPQVLPERPDPIAALVEAHGCWTGEAPADVEIPGHVIVTHRGLTERRGEVFVGRALEQIFDGIDHGLDVHAFCR